MPLGNNKIVTADEVVAVIRDGDTVAISGLVGIGTASSQERVAV